uniref:Thioredoxin domain-containing protein 17 n=2 Tax=Plectus sambesii TaxID=2011161 RepID=A0A914XKV0_9BILA
MVEFKEVEGYDSLKSELKSLEKSDKPVFVLFTGSKDSSGKSWCPDCVTADPVVHASVKEKLSEGVFITCQVGPRDFWKNQSNPFRTDSKLKITAVPTLIHWGQSNRLVEEQLFKRDMVDMLFED